MTQLVYDGTFHGFLTSVFESYERKLSDFRIVRQSHFQPVLLGDALTIVSDKAKSDRVWMGLKKKLSGHAHNNIYKAFLSESNDIECLLTDFIKYVFSSNTNIESDLGDARVVSLKKVAHQVHREKHRMEAFVRFQRTKEDLYYASITPDFNVVPLIVPHFKDRYADQHWLIYDRKRHYGIQYDCLTQQVVEVLINFDQQADRAFLPESLCHEEELEYQSLWKKYFYSVNINPRKNTQLHVRHVPVRYWRYPTEKQA
ncbi:MAG: TIGR03915 family putative DNA repair protein [Chryseolinea sp.]